MSKKSFLRTDGQAKTLVRNLTRTFIKNDERWFGTNQIIYQKKQHLLEYVFSHETIGNHGILGKLILIDLYTVLNVDETWME